MGRPTKKSLRASIRSGHNGRQIGAPPCARLPPSAPSSARSKSIFTDGPKTPPKTRLAHNLGLGPKNGPHQRPQNRVGAWASPINEPALPCRPLCGKILSGAPTHRGSANPMPGAPLAATPPLSRRFLLPETSRRCFPPLFPSEEPASRRSAAINRGVIGGGETPKNNSNGRPPGDLGEGEGGGAAALPR
jgi:hypothetical protein